MLQFQNITYLILLALVLLVVLMFFRAKYKKKQAAKRIGDPVMVKQLTAHYKPFSFFAKFLLLAIALSSLVIALANLRKPSGENSVTRNGIDVMIALDVSKSMLAQDISPTRLDRAKQFLSRLIDRLSNNRMGIVVFAGKAYLQMPLTGDAGAAKMYLSSATTESVPTQGTVIGDALKMCYASFNTKEKKYKAVLLVSDGEDHDEAAVKVASEMASEGIVIYTVGIGSPQGSPIMDESTGQYKKDNQGNTVISKLNEGELISIAQKGNGKYQLFKSTDEVVRNLYNQFNSMDQRAVKDDSLINYQSFFQYFLGLAFLLLLWEMLVSEVKRSKGVSNQIKKLKPTVTIISILFFSSAVFAQSDNEFIKKGNEAYKKNDFPTAAASYEKVVQKNAGNSTANYNLGNALYKASKADDAIASYDKAIASMEKPLQKADANYNKGVVLQNNKKIPECIESYKAALRLNPNHEDARQNLQRALQQQKEQDKQDKKDKDKNKDQNKDDKKKDEDKQPKPQPSKLTKKDAEEKLKALMQQEKNLQDKLHKVNAASVEKPEKDW
ncbi:MAG: VWA domain-containing protein [Ferruginibacter sp.]